jgi:hypothetical protein
MAEEHLTRFMNRAMTLHSSSEPKVGSFVGCAARFNGTRNEQLLQKFILNVTLYKDVERISDEVALHELYLLLEGKAATWWTRAKENIFNWSEALIMLQKEFSPKKSEHEIYTEIFATKQDEYIPTEIFIRRKQALMNALPLSHSEDVQINVIYSLLKPKIQRKIPRETVCSLDQLIAAAIRVEHKKNMKREKHFANLDFETTKAAKRSKPKCSSCKRSTGSGSMENRDCYSCNLLQRKRSKGGRKHTRPTTINPVKAIPLHGLNPNSNPSK